ncbi:MAG TPA: hypothetical protein VMJ65_28315 [Solirubrobacteraceae bacterium]|nr:hypothetical protein [Solirubrobacteraceae bacterium]
MQSSLLTIWPEQKYAPDSGCLLERTTEQHERWLVVGGRLHPGRIQKRCF